MSFDTFVGESGLKVLAMARLEQCEYALMLYLLNCSASGLDEFITTERELSSLMGFDERELRDSMASLSDKQMIVLKFGDKHQANITRQSIRVGIQYDTKEWQLGFESDIDTHDAIVFPFRRGENLHLVGLPESTIPSTKPGKSLPTWKRVYNSFAVDKSLSEIELANTERDAKILVDTHPVDQVLLMLRHFGERIPTLSLLASSWQHYQGVFEQETQKVDLMGARQKHIEMDDRFREAVVNVIEEKEQLGLSSEEVRVLDILFSHRHPRRQLFWAYQSRSRYPNLRNFFQENAKHMLPVTSNGIVIKKKPHQDS